MSTNVMLSNVSTPNMTGTATANDTETVQPTKSSWMFWSSWRKNGQWRVPIGVVLALYTMIVTIAIALASWSLTSVSGSQSVAQLVTQLQAETMQTFKSVLTQHFVAVERATDVHQNYWRRGLFSMDNKDAAVRILLANLLPNIELFSDQYFVTVPQGEMFGYLYTYETNVVVATPDSPHRLAKWWNADNGTFFESRVDNNGDLLGNNTLQTTGDAANFSQGLWVTIVCPPPYPDIKAWTPMYTWYGSGWLSFSEPLYDPNNTVLGTVSTDLELTFVDSLVRTQSASLNYGNFLYVLELGVNVDESIVSAVEPGLNARILNDDGSVAGMKSVSQVVNTSLPLAALQKFYTSQGFQNVLDLLNSRGEFNTELTVANIAYTVQISQFSHYNLHWAMIQFLNKNDVEALIIQNNRLTAALVATVIIVGMIMTIIFSLILSRSMRRITDDIILLSNYKFREVLHGDDGSVVKQPTRSHLLELNDIQQSFHRLVITFSHSIQNNRQLANGKTASKSNLLSRTDAQKTEARID